MKINDHNNNPNNDRNIVFHNATAEQWWAKLSPVQKVLVHQVGRMMEDINENKRIEIRKELEKIRARFIHILKQPEDECVSAIMLPEPSPKYWN
jgi:hypothetical protein